MFGTSGYESTTGSSFIKPGISEVEIKGVKAGKSAVKQTDFIEFTVEDVSGATASHQYYMSTTEGPSGKTAMSISMPAIKQIGEAAIGKEKIDAVSGATIEQYAMKLNTVLLGKKLRMKFNGKEIQGTNGKANWTKAEFGNGFFAESLETPAAETKLKFDPSKNIKLLPQNLNSAASPMSISNEIY